MEATNACTVIPSDFRDLHNTPLKYPSFSNILSCIQICGQTPTNPDVQYHTIAIDFKKEVTKGTSTKTTGKDTLMPFEMIYNDMKTTSGTCDFVLVDSLLYVSAVQAMMLWCLNEEDRSVTIHIVDNKFNRPAGWSYRYFWRHQSKTHKGGLSINHVAVIAKGQGSVKKKQ